MTEISDSATIEELAALVSGALSRAGITAVLSGGGAVQIYTSGLYVSRDLDFVSPATAQEIAAAVRPQGFERTSAALGGFTAAIETGKFWVISAHSGPFHDKRPAANSFKIGRASAACHAQPRKS